MTSTIKYLHIANEQNYLNIRNIYLKTCDYQKERCIGRLGNLGHHNFSMLITNSWGI